MVGETVNVENFRRAETDRMFLTLQGAAGGVNVFNHNRQPASLDKQPIIRQNRDTLYSLAVVDLSGGATLTVPNAGDRYLSVMVINQDHYANRIIHDPGQHELAAAEFETDYVMVGARIMVDPTDPADVAAVNDLQNQLHLEAGSARLFVSPAYDTASLDATRDALLTLGRGIRRYDHTFGRKQDVDPVRHLIGTAVGWAGLPEYEAFYINVEPGLPVGDYQLTVGDVPVDAFWSISVYNAAGYFEPSNDGLVSINSVTADRNEDGSITVQFGRGDQPNTLGIMDGWNYTVRLYRPRPEILDGSWAFPPLGS